MVLNVVAIKNIVFQYPANFKKEVRLYAEVLGQRPTARLFVISQKRIHDWVTEAKSNSTSRQREAVLQSRRNKLSRLRKTLPVLTASLEMKNFQAHECTPTKKQIDARVEQQIWEWIESQQPRKVSSNEVREMARRVFQENGRSEIECSYGWYRRFKARMHKTVGMKKGLENLHEEEDSLILEWLLKMYDNNQLVSYRTLQTFAQTALCETKPQFKASVGWITRFLKRNHIIINWNQGVYQNALPTLLECLVTPFVQEVKTILREYPENCVGCMDEIPLTFARPTNKLQIGYEQNEEDEYEDGSQVSRLRKISVKNCDATALLAILADGTLLPPMVIVKVNACLEITLSCYLWVGSDAYDVY